jgi:hydrophobic/amphiphilic exporter-1 (mainly G- bacteria), HAE1 family
VVAGMLPVAIGWGGDSEFRAPMAIAVIGGLLTSTVLTLVVVPAVFTILDDLERWLAPRASKLLAPPPGSVAGEGDEPPTPGPAAAPAPGAGTAG